MVTAGGGAGVLLDSSNARRGIPKPSPDSIEPKSRQRAYRSLAKYDLELSKKQKPRRADCFGLGGAFNS
jgi:hypothetical protein